LWCYEKDRSKTLHAFRSRLNLFSKAKDTNIKKDYDSKEYSHEKKDNFIKCPNCESSRFERKGFRVGKQRYICKDCGRNWTEGLVYTKKNKIKTAKVIQKPKIDFYKEIKNCIDSRRSVQINYKGKSRVIDPYVVNDTYFSGYCHYAKDIRTFRIDRIKGITEVDSYECNKSLEEEASEKILEARNYRNFTRY
jgi:transposase-like protein